MIVVQYLESNLFFLGGIYKSEFENHIKKKWTKKKLLTGINETQKHGKLSSLVQLHDLLTHNILNNTIFEKVYNVNNE